MYFEAGATAGADAQYDAQKLANSTGFNLASVAGSDFLAINGLPVLTKATVVPLTVTVPLAGTYSLHAAELLHLPAGTAVYLFDATTGQYTDLRRQPVYRFTLASDAAPTGRFSLHFAPATPTGTTAGLTAGQVSVFPNPARHHFTVLVPPVAGARQGKVAVFNTLGQQVHEQPLVLTAEGARATVPATGLATGLYFLRVTLGDATVTRQVLIE